MSKFTPLCMIVLAYLCGCSVYYDSILPKILSIVTMAFLAILAGYMGIILTKTQEIIKAREWLKKLGEGAKSE